MLVFELTMVYSQVKAPRVRQEADSESPKTSDSKLKDASRKDKLPDQKLVHICVYSWLHSYNQCMQICLLYCLSQVN